MIGGAIAIILLIGIAGLHVFWALGGHIGQSAAVPERNGKPAFKPGPIATFAVAVALVVAVLLVAAHLGWIASPVPTGLVRVLVWMIVVAFAARAIGDFRYVGFFKRVRDTRFARLDTRVFSPLCAVLAIAVTDAVIEGRF
ncbi:MAG TPA: DUF3995 domain-containing protein [Magnetospirillaceae bacterium]